MYNKSNLKYFLATLFILIIILNIFKYQISLINFYLQQNKISKTLCIKKEIKNNDCQGHCQLNKKIIQIENTKSNESKSEINKIIFEIIIFIITSNKIDLNIFFNKINKTKNYFYNIFFANGLRFKEIKPPII